MSDPISARAFLESRRPNSFSDSVTVKSAALNRTMLEQHLETLTTRMQEHKFAEFARKLCQLEITPNLRPQTGPVGGGDSKVDSETIPAASQIRIAYYQGQDSQTNEPFGFAFSAKKAWTEKARKDVRGIYNLKRGYRRIYFVTNQAARDKTRASIEKELSTECGVDVVILDKTWILDRVFTNKRERLAIDELEMSDGLEEVRRVGPLDFQRRQRLEDLNTLIEGAVSNSMVTHSVVRAALDAAILAKELDEPRTQVDGQFARAIRLAQHHGNNEHLLSALYQQAWATYFWFEEFPTFVRLYDEVESLAIKSHSIFSVERLCNLWSLLRALAQGPDVVSEEIVDGKARTLRASLNWMIASKHNPSAAVQAEAMLCILDLSDSQQNHGELGKAFRRLKSVVDRAITLVGFPFDSIVNLLAELDMAFSGVAEYEELQEHLITITSRRRGEIPAGEMFLQRGIQHVTAKRYYEAIECVGHSLVLFFKQESRENLVIALRVLAYSYREVGLLWAARGALLHAASHATSEFWVYNTINAAQLQCYSELKMLELQLGRVGAALDWHNTHVPLAMQLVTTEAEREELVKGSMHFGAIMGLLVIKSREEDLKWIETLPDTLLGMDLDFAAFGLAYRLGGKDGLPGVFPKELGGDDPDAFFGSWLTQPAQEELPDSPDYYLSGDAELCSSILGCRVIVRSNRGSPQIEVAEYIVAGLESFLATTIELGAVSRESVMCITVAEEGSVADNITYKINRDGKVNVEVTCGAFNPHSLSIEQQRRIGEQVSEIVLHLIAESVIFRDPIADLEKLFKNEKAGSRAFNFSCPFVTLGNVFGDRHTRSITDWVDEANKRYPYAPGKCPLSIEPKSGKRASALANSEERRSTSHSEIRNNSMIRMHLWDGAGWHGALYMTSESGPPVLGLLFKDETSARAIFRDWKETLGDEDRDDIIRLVVARGVDAQHPAWYRIGVGTKIDVGNRSSETLITVTRLHTMTPSTTANLERFVESYRRSGMFLLAPAIMREGASIPEVLIDSGIVKHDVVERNAWEIGPNDIDLALITPDTNPVIPEGITDAPALETLNKIRAMKEGKRSTPYTE